MLHFTKMPEEKRIRVAALCGSLREGSYTKMALTVALRAAAGSTSETDVIDLREFNLPLADGRKSPSEETRRFCDRLANADAVLIGTPEYHGSLSGVLKNALDLTGFPEWEGKMIGLVGIDRKSTRLNSSHLVISYAVFCLRNRRCRHTLVLVRHSSGLKSARSTSWPG